MTRRPKAPLRLALAALTVIGIASLPVRALDRLDFVTSGADDALAKTVRETSLLGAMQAAGQTDPQDLLAAARADYGRILAAMYASGHYSVVIQIRIDGREAASIPPIEVPETVSVIEVRVDPGPLFRFGTARITPLPDDSRLPYGFQAGEAAESGLIALSATAAIKTWREAGYAKAGIVKETVVADHRTHVLDVDLQVSPGPKLRFGALAVEGETRMREKRVRKIASLPEGESFSETALLRAEARLRRTGIFSSVTLTEDDRITAPDLLGVTATVVEQKPRRYSLGAEIASLDGLSLEGSWLHRNLLGGGERLKLEGTASNISGGSSGVDYALGLSLDRPATLTPDTTAGIRLGYAHMDEIDFAVDSLEFGLNFVHIFSDKLSAKAGLVYSYQTGQDPGGEFTYRNLSVPIGLTWDRRDNSRDAKKGFYLDATAMPFLGFGTTGSGLSGTFDARTYRELGSSGRVVLALRAQGGAVLGPDVLDTPRDLLFFSGGGGTVRGQPYRSLGIPITKGMGPEFDIGGRYFLAGSIELRLKLTERIGLVGFVDAGSVGLSGFADGIVEPHAGAGLGLRYDTGFGPIRLDIAAPVSGSTGDGVQIYVGLGQAF